MTNRDKAQFIITDILTNHLPRIKEALLQGYVDENQILVIYDHAVRARTLKETKDIAEIDENEISNEQDEKWLAAIAKEHFNLTGKPWTTRDDIEANVSAFVEIISERAKGTQ